MATLNFLAKLRAQQAAATQPKETESASVDAPSQPAVAQEPTSAPVPSQEVATQQAVAIVDSVEADGPANFQLMLDRFDEVCRAAGGITVTEHDIVKAHVKEIMLDLQQNPEMAGLLIDRDVHNIMMFVQSASTRSEEKIESVAIKRQKKISSNKLASAFDNAFDDLLLGGPATSLDTIGDLNTDGIQTQTRR